MHPWAILLAMITMRKSIHGLPSLSYIWVWYSAWWPELHYEMKCLVNKTDLSGSCVLVCHFDFGKLVMFGIPLLSKYIVSFSKDRWVWVYEYGSVFTGVTDCVKLANYKDKYWIKRTTVLKDMFWHAYAIFSLIEWHLYHILLVILLNWRSHKHAETCLLKQLYVLFNVTDPFRL